MAGPEFNHISCLTVPAADLKAWSFGLRGAPALGGVDRKVLGSQKIVTFDLLGSLTKLKLGLEEGIWLLNVVRGIHANRSHGIN